MSSRLCVTAGLGNEVLVRSLGRSGRGGTFTVFKGFILTRMQ